MIIRTHPLYGGLHVTVLTVQSHNACCLSWSGGTGSWWTTWEPTTPLKPLASMAFPRPSVTLWCHSKRGGFLCTSYIIQISKSGPRSIFQWGSEWTSPIMVPKFDCSHYCCLVFSPGVRFKRCVLGSDMIQHISFLWKEVVHRTILNFQTWPWSCSLCMKQVNNAFNIHNIWQKLCAVGYEKAYFEKIRIEILPVFFNF